MDLLIAYDIAEDKKRNKIFKELKYLGFQNIQYSVFLGINIGELELKLSRKLFEYLDVDNYFITPINLEKFEKKGISIEIDEVEIF